MAKLLRYVLAFETIPIILAGTLTVLGNNVVPTEGGAVVPLATLHVMGMSSLSLAAVHLIIATTGTRNQLRTIMAIALPMKLLAAGLFQGDGMSGAAIWEVITGVLSGACAFFG